MSTRTLPTIPHWASYTPDTGTAELPLPLRTNLPPLGEAAATEAMHILDLRPRLEPLKQSWNSMLTVAGVAGLVALVAALALGIAGFGEWLYENSNFYGTDHF